MLVNRSNQAIASRRRVQSPLSSCAGPSVRLRSGIFCLFLSRCCGTRTHFWAWTLRLARPPWPPPSRPRGFALLPPAEFSEDAERTFEMSASAPPPPLTARLASPPSPPPSLPARRRSCWPTRPSWRSTLRPTSYTASPMPTRPSPPKLVRRSMGRWSPLLASPSPPLLQQPPPPRAAPPVSADAWVADARAAASCVAPPPAGAAQRGRLRSHTPPPPRPSSRSRSWSRRHRCRHRRLSSSSPSGSSSRGASPAPPAPPPPVLPPPAAASFPPTLVTAKMVRPRVVAGVVGVGGSEGDGGRAPSHVH